MIDPGFDTVVLSLPFQPLDPGCFLDAPGLTSHDFGELVRCRHLRPLGELGRLAVKCRPQGRVETSPGPIRDIDMLDTDLTIREGGTQLWHCGSCLGAFQCFRSVGETGAGGVREVFLRERRQPGQRLHQADLHRPGPTDQTTNITDTCGQHLAIRDGQIDPADPVDQAMNRRQLHTDKHKQGVSQS